MLLSPLLLISAGTEPRVSVSRDTPRSYQGSSCVWGLGLDVGVFVTNVFRNPPLVKPVTWNPQVSFSGFYIKGSRFLSQKGGG